LAKQSKEGPQSDESFFVSRGQIRWKPSPFPAFFRRFQGNGHSKNALDAIKMPIEENPNASSKL
jgi:hypothetical protein